jgi:hypothetical protein
MRLITYCFLFFTTTSFGQDCKTLDNFTSFHGVKFGKQFPDSLRKYCDIDYNEVRSDFTFSISNDKIKAVPKFSEWLVFRLSFSNIAFGALKDGRIYCAVLQQDLDNTDSIYLSHNEYPLFFEQVTEELSSLFGKLTKQDNTDDIFGNKITREWDCEKMRVTLSLYRLGHSSYYSLMIIDKELEKQRAILKYK